MTARDDIARLLKEASASMKADAKGAVAKLETAHRLALGEGPALAAEIAEELSRGWARRRSAAKSLHYAHKSTRLAPERKAAWTTLAKTCELVAARTEGPRVAARARALYRAAAHAFERAASLTKDPEDRRWLLELARDAAKQAKPPKG
jgi:hypothetical protein